MPRHTPRDHARAALDAVDRDRFRRTRHDTGHSRNTNANAAVADVELELDGAVDPRDYAEDAELVDTAYARLLRQLAIVPDDYLFGTDATARLFRRSPLTLATWRTTRVGPGGLTPPAFVKLHNRKIYYRADTLRAFLNVPARRSTSDSPDRRR